ncbi:hypothetical protein [Demequina pelophila]|uniref:hypothetical protein n=1 Tax=Demequina pelophila TaxID=1638984 RepID=UPI0007816D4B|nr:hypothetical protein [Demequina pelophila]
MSLEIFQRRAAVAAGAAAFALLLAACGTAEADEVDAAATVEADAHDDHDDHDHEAEGHDDHDQEAEEQAAVKVEMPTQTPRLVLTYDGGLVVLDANSLEVEADLALDGFNRIKPVGDDRHVAVSTAGGFAIVDAGTWTWAHGDHFHYYTTQPQLTDVLVEADVPGHVVAHDGFTAFFDDGTGEVTIVETSEWVDMVEHGHLHVIRDYTADEAHHGVAIPTAAGELMVTIGDADGRTGAMLLDADGETIVSSDRCPGVHGETAFTTAGGEDLLMVGCEDGVLVFHGDHIHKVASGLEYARTGNLFSVDGSDVVLGDRKTDPAQGIGLNEVVLVNAETEVITVVDPFEGADAEYTWRGLARGDKGEALVLGTDGALRVLDENTGEVLRTIDVTAAWDVPEAWQTPHPALTVLAGMAYVTEPSTGTVHIVDYVGGAVWKSVEVGVEMNEMVGVSG